MCMHFSGPPALGTTPTCQVRVKGMVGHSHNTSFGTAKVPRYGTSFSWRELVWAAPQLAGRSRYIWEAGTGGDVDAVPAERSDANLVQSSMLGYNAKRRLYLGRHRPQNAEKKESAREFLG